MHMFLKGWWFIGYYVFIIIYADFSLNNLLSLLDKKKHLTFIVVLLLLVSFAELFYLVQPTFGMASSPLNDVLCSNFPNC